MIDPTFKQVSAWTYPPHQSSTTYLDTILNSCLPLSRYQLPSFFRIWLISKEVLERGESVETAHQRKIVALHHHCSGEDDGKYDGSWVEFDSLAEGHVHLIRCRALCFVVHLWDVRIGNTHATDSVIVNTKDAIVSMTD
jgi:hypothetical protein